MAERTRPVGVGSPESAATDATATDGTATDATATEPTTDPTTARIEVPAEEFALADLFETVPDARVDLEPAVASPDHHALVGVETDPRDQGAIEAALRHDPAIAAVETFGEREGAWTYRVTWAGRAREFLGRTLAAGLTIVATWARRGTWSFRLLAPDRAALSRGHETLEASGYRPECMHISSLDGHPADRSDLTDQQREAVVTAFEAGYYEVPRNDTAEELANRLGISHQALSERFRRAHEHLIETALRVEG